MTTKRSRALATPRKRWADMTMFESYALMVGAGLIVISITLLALVLHVYFPKGPKYRRAKRLVSVVVDATTPAEFEEGYLTRKDTFIPLHEWEKGRRK